MNLGPRLQAKMIALYEDIQGRNGQVSSHHITIVFVSNVTKSDNKNFTSASFGTSEIFFDLKMRFSWNTVVNLVSFCIAFSWVMNRKRRWNVQNMLVLWHSGVVL